MFVEVVDGGAVPRPEEVGGKRSAAESGCLLGGAAAGLMVGMEVAEPGSEDVGGGRDVRKQEIDEGVFAFGDGAVGEVQAMDGGRRDTKAREGSVLLALGG